MHIQRFWRLGAAALFLTLVIAGFGGATGPASARLQQGTPPPDYSCERATPAAEAVGAGTTMGSPMAGMEMGSPMAGMEMDIEFDQLYIDMMIPHHVSIVALAQAALPRLTDPGLQAIAQSIVSAQSAEIEELSGYRQQFYGSPESMPMDAHMMDMTMAAMPGMGSMADMEAQMDPESQVASFCAATDPDLGFIELTIAHHEMAIVASEAALDQATHQEIREFAERVIEDQRREIDELTSIRAELAGDATPAAG